MASRFTDTELWKEDWFCEMPGEYQHFTKYVFDHCDNAGVWKPNKFDFETKTKFKVSLDSLFEKMNKGAQRVLLLKNGRWFLTGYIFFQWFNKKKTFDLVLSNKLHGALYKSLMENGVLLQTVRGLQEVLKGSMVMEVVIDTPKVFKGGTGGIEFSLQTNLPENVLESAEMNQFTHTQKKNTDFVKSQWKLFLSERMNEPDKIYRQMSDLTGHFLNWIRTKFPKHGSHFKPPTSKRDNANAFAEQALAEYESIARGTKNT